MINEHCEFIIWIKHYNWWVSLIPPNQKDIYKRLLKLNVFKRTSPSSVAGSASDTDSSLGLLSISPSSESSWQRKTTVQHSVESCKWVWLLYTCWADSSDCFTYRKIKQKTTSLYLVWFHHHSIFPLGDVNVNSPLSWMKMGSRRSNGGWMAQFWNTETQSPWIYPVKHTITLKV